MKRSWCRESSMPSSAPYPYAALTSSQQPMRCPHLLHGCPFSVRDTSSFVPALLLVASACYRCRRSGPAISTLFPWSCPSITAKA